MENQNHQQIRDTQEFTQDYDPGNPPVSIFCWATSIVTKITTFLGAYLLRKTEGQGKWHHSQWNQMWWQSLPTIPNQRQGHGAFLGCWAHTIEKPREKKWEKGGVYWSNHKPPLALHFFLVNLYVVKYEHWTETDWLQRVYTT